MVKFLVEEKTRLLHIPTKKDKNTSEEEMPKFITVGTNLFNIAVDNGFTEILGYLMSKTGLGFPFEDLMKEAGIKAELKPKVCGFTIISVFRGGPF